MYGTGLDEAALRAALAPRWARVDVVAQTDSTNADLLADVDAPDRSVLIAEQQLAGRGRLDRSWISPPGAGLEFSALLRPSVPIAAWGWLPLLTGVALHEAVSDVTGLAMALKWPNDLLCGPEQRKVAGILAQTSGEAVVIGIGLNVSTTADDLPVPGATSLALCGATDLDRASLLVAVLSSVDVWLQRWADAGGDAAASGLAAAYRDVCATLGQFVTVTGTDGAVVTGTAVGIDGDGRLVVRADGVERTVGAGDVHHLRPA